MPLSARLLRPARPRGRAGAARLRPGARDSGRPGGGRAHRGRGVRRPDRPGVPCLPGADPAERGHVRPARSRLRLFHLRHAFLREPGLRRDRERVRGPAAGRGGHRGGEPGPGATVRPCARRRGTSGRTPLAARDLARGPARLCRALDIDRSLDGADVCVASAPLRVRGPEPGARTTVRSGKIVCGPRVGVSQAAEVPWRFWFADEPTVSVYRAHVPRRPKLVTP